IILSYNTKKRMLPLQKLLSRYGWMGVFTAAATPIPDDIVYIPLGIAKYSPLKFASALFVGQFILGGVIVVISIYFGRPFIEYLIAETSNPISLIIIAAITIAIILQRYIISSRWTGGRLLENGFPGR
ncbi:MAG TPA: VTT domain-containing protein, partial [Nitrososphaeraceae archaeon]|nr:VTT domain-containing protein [Nitrososphaeraceae archaeon]